MFQRLSHLKQNTLNFTRTLSIIGGVSFNKTQILFPVQCYYCEKCLKSRIHFKASNLLNRNVELQAWRQLLQRSAISTDLIPQRHSPNGVPVPGSRRCFSTSTPLCQDNNQNDDKDDKKEGTPPLTKWVFLTYPIILALFTWSAWVLSDNSPATISWPEFVNDLLLKGEVDHAIVHQSSSEDYKIHVRLHPGRVFKESQPTRNVYVLNMPDPNQFEEKLRKLEDSIGIKPGEGLPIHYKRVSNIGPLLTMILVGVIVYSVAKRVKLPEASDLFGSFTQAKYKRADILATGKKGIGFKDVAGLHEAKIEIMEFVDYLKSPQRFQTLGAKVPKGALLTGPPGCGKTLLAKALATEAQVPFLVMAGSEFVEVIGGLGASRVRNLFKDARSKAPCIIYVDEIDAIGRERTGDNWSGSSDEEQTLNQLLVELDGMGTVDGVIMLASTNRADVLDKALLRPGRFDRHINIDFPTLAERKEIFEMYLKKLKLARPAMEYVERLSQLSPGMSGADISNICNEAALFAARSSKKAVESNDFDYAVERVIAGTAKKSCVLSVKEKKMIAYHEAGHALVGWLLTHTDLLLRVSIVPRTNNTLGFAQYSPQDKHLHSKEELFEKMCLALGGRVAESLIFNHVTSGAQDDLKKVTQMAYLQIKSLGMSKAVGHLSFPMENDGDFQKKPYSRRLSAIIDQEATSLVANAYKATEKIIQENKEKLRIIAEALLEKEVLTYQDMEQLIGPPPHQKRDQLTDWTPTPEHTS